MAQPLQPGPIFRVLHRTVFDYDAPVRDSINTLHLEPRTFPYQKTLGALIRVIPATRLRRFTDLFQNITHQFELPAAHSRLEIESKMRVHNLPLDIGPVSREATLDDYGDPTIRERIWPYLQESRWVSRHSEVWRQAVDVTGGLASVYDKAYALMTWIYREFRYVPGATTVNTHLEEAFAMKKGVCQDFAPVMLACLRSLGLAARYVSGYLLTMPAPGQPRLIGSDASHAWVSVYLPGQDGPGQWSDLDPTNNRAPGEDYVTLAIGRDYSDVSPVRGVIHGGAHHTLHVAVTVAPLSSL